MARIIGILTGWSCEDWIEPAIKQGLEYTDELHVCISAHSDNLLKFEDNTLDIAMQYKDQAIVSTYQKRSVHSETKANILNYCLSNSKYMEEENWIWVLDVDEFFKQDSYEYVKKLISANICDQICFEAKFFYIDTKHYILSDHNRLFKIKDKNNRFYPTQQWRYGNRLCRVHVDLGMFHYSMLQNPYMKMEFWKSEYSYEQNHKLQWLDKIYRNYDLKNEEYWLEQNKKLTGNYGPWISDSFVPQVDGTLYKYEGKHPKLVEEKGFTKIEDYRKHWKFT